ncbi:MAG TPA: TonB-dependent receptor, partial [Pseudomonadales bacterium]|nr:TonB-dependent receptor [Pseudomonadales bacterium]
LFNLAIGAFAGSQFVNPVAGLRPETSTTRELGARFVDDRFMFELTLFHTSANDYIDHVNCDTGDPCLTTADQIYKNVGSATTFGLESSARFSVDTTTVYADITWLRRHKQYEGVDTFNAGVPMLSGRLGVERNIGDELHVDLFSRFESSADTTEMTRRGATTDHHGGFATLNTELNWNLSGVVRINVGLENLADRRYSFATENLLAPGRHVSASIAMEF